MKELLPYATAAVVENFLKLDAYRNIKNWERALELHNNTEFCVWKLRNATDVIFIGNPQFHDIETIYNYITNDKIIDPIIVALIENYHELKNIGYKPEFVVVTHNSEILRNIPDDELSNCVIFYPITLAPHHKNVKTIYYFAAPYAKLNISSFNFSKIAFVKTCMEPVLTTLELIAKFQYWNIHLIQPISTSIEKTINNQVHVKTIKGTAWTSVGAIVANTMIKFWLKTKNKYPIINLTLYNPDIDIFGYKVKEVKKIWI